MFKNRRREHHDLKSEINIIPLLDILLVILLIFIATFPLSTQNIKINLPNGTESKTIETVDNSTLIVEVSGVEQYSIIANQNRKDQLLPEKIIAEAKRYIQLNPKTVFLIGGEKSVPYNEIIKVINLLHSAGVRSISLITQPIDYLE